MEGIEERIKEIKFQNCEKKLEHKQNEKKMVCIDKDCIGSEEDRYMQLMCSMCVDENAHAKENHKQKPFQKVVSDLMKELACSKQESDRIKSKFDEIYAFIDSLKAAVLDEALDARVDSILQSIIASTTNDNTNDNKEQLMLSILKVLHDIGYNEETNEISIKSIINHNNSLNQSIDSDVDSNVANELFKDFKQLIGIFKSNNHQFDQNIILPLQGYRLLSDVKDSPLGSIDKERMFKDAFKLDSTLIHELKRAPSSRRQSLEMFEADKKVTIDFKYRCVYILLLMNENDRINSSLNAKQDEIDILKIKLQRAEDELKSKHISNPDEEDPQVKILKFELERVNKALEYKNNEIDSLYQKNSSKIAENGETIIELQAQIDMLIQENERLNSVILAKDEEIGSIQSISNIEDKTNEGFKAEIIRLNKIINEQNSKIDNISNENNKIIETKNEEIKHWRDQQKSLQSKYSLFGSQIEKLSKEVDRLNLEISLKTKEIDIWKNKIPKETLLPTPKDIPKEVQNQPIQNIMPIQTMPNPIIPQYAQYNTSHMNSINASKVLNNYGSAFLSTQQSTQAFITRDRLGSEGQGINYKQDQTKSASHIKKISAIDRIDIYKRNDQIQQPLSSRFKSPPSLASKNQMNITQSTAYINDYEVQNMSLITPPVQKNQNNHYSLGSTMTIDRKTVTPSYNTSQDEKLSSLSSSINYYKTYKQNSQFSSPPSSVQSIIPYKERIDNKIQNLSKEIGKLNNILDNKNQPEKKSSISQFQQNIIKQQNFRSGSEGLKNKNFK